MENTEALVQAQTENGEAIQAIIRNYKKDSADRKKNADYFDERLRRLQATWREFQDVDSKLRVSCKNPMTLDYFAEGYYDKISALTCEYMQLFKEEADRLKMQKISKPATPTLTVTNPQFNVPNVSSDHQSIVRDIKARMATLIRLLDGISSEKDSQPYQYYIFKTKTVEEHWKVVEEMYYNMCSKCEDPSKYNFEEDDYYTLENRVQHQLVDLSVKASMNQKNNVSHPMATTGSSVQSTLTLPKITIPRFDGNYLKWRQFHDLFLEMVEKQPIPAIQKMWYLKTNLSGEAEQLISQFTLTEENYATAWKMLQDRYNNKRVLVANLIDKMLNQSSGTSTAAAIKSLHDTTKECLLALNNLGIDTSNWDAILLQLLNKKLDKNTHIRFVQSLKNPKEVPSITELLSFLEIQFQALEATGQKDRPTYKAISSAVSFHANNSVCQFCSTETHKLFQCDKFLELLAPARLQWVQKQKLCVNCLKPNHTSQTCNSRSCLKCSKKHNTLLHLEKQLQPMQQTSKKFKAGTTIVSNQTSPTRHDSTPANTAAVSSASTEDKKNVILATARVIIKAANGISDEFRAILDSGSQVNIVTERLVKRLALRTTETALSIDGVGRIQKRAYHRVNMKMMSRNHEFATNLEAFVLPTIIPAQPNHNLDVSNWKIPQDVHLADPNFNTQGKIDILLGAEFYFSLLQPGTIKLTKNLPILQNTSLGWIVGGLLKQPTTDLPSATLICAVFDNETSLEQTIEQLWKLDEVESNEKIMSPVENLCESHFNQHVQRDLSGRFIVNLPFSASPTTLGQSHRLAYNRFISLEQRLQKNTDIQGQYIQFMREYENLGHMQKVNLDNISNPKYFIPHHCVMKPDSTSTKLRVVFDASAKTSTGHSLNDLMYTGPTIQSELFSILLRFRMPKFVFTTDIEKMYRQILISPDNYQYQLIIWRENPSLPINYYRLNTVTYGTRAAPYLATKCLQRIAEENMDRYPLGSQMLKENFYMDDGIGGSDSLNKAVQTQKELITILKKHGFNLRKWCSNTSRLLKEIPHSDREVNLEFNDNISQTIKTLGLYWTPQTDQFCIKVKTNHLEVISKRTVTSELAKLFDPLGLLAPIVVKAKIFIQQLWQLTLDWDEPLPQKLCVTWNTFRGDLESLHNFKIPRHIFYDEIPTKIQLHVFADASEKAFGAAAYIRSTTKDGRVAVRLLCAKSRVAPLKQQTLPRLELCGAVVAAQLANRVKIDLKLQNQPMFLWTDSEIVLYWIKSQSSLYKTFVANRVSTVQTLTLPEQWRHVQSKDNPADILSRGLRPSDLSRSGLWFHGPVFLHGKEELWPAKFSPESSTPNNMELKKVVTAAIVTTDTDLIYKIQHKNSFKTLQNVLGYVLRFIKNLKIQNESRPKHISLSPKELNDSRVTIIRAVQISDFKKEISELKKNNQVDKSSTISGLCPFLDENNILRVGGRLEASNLSYDAKHPILLPYNDSVSKLILTMLHGKNYHCGPQSLLAISRQQYWIIKGKSMARNIVQNCVRCTRAKPRLLSQIMGDLPASRITPSRPFIKSGVDYCGPFWVHYKIRGKKPHKVYIAVFVCFSTKAVHLEVVTELTTDAFIGALKRFISRRGRCQTIYSDNATNFIGTRNQLEELNQAIFDNNSQEKILQSCSKEGIEFKFIPPRAPHFGGLWEAAVKSAKHLLLRSVSTASLTHEELETVIIEIEAILNSRPLTPMSSNPNDLTALTPGHFLIGEPLTAQVDSRAHQPNSSLTTRWKLVSQLKHEFWRRWSDEYLHQLQERQKWKSSSENVKEGQMVIIKEDNLPVMNWPLGRIIQTHEGNDGKVRVADVKTTSGTKRRPIHRLAPLLHEDELPASGVSNPISPIPVDEEDTPPTKKSKTSTNSMLLTMIVAILIIPAIMGSNVEVHNFHSDPGLYFEGIGTVKLATAEWKLVVYYDLAPFLSELKTFQSGLVTLQHLCSTITHQSTCNILINNFNQVKEELLEEKELFATSRVKRGAFNIVGNVARSLFGVLDSDYANEMSDTIKKAKVETGYIFKLLRNQTSIIDSTINIIKQDELSTQKQLREIVARINKEANALAKESSEVSQTQLISLLASQLTLTALNLQRVEKEIIDVLTDAHHEKISPLLLSPHQLRTELSTIKAHLPVQRTLPIEEDSLVQLYKLMKANGVVTKDEVLFEIRLPLIDQQFLELLKITPVPTIRNNALISIKSDVTFLAVNPHRDEFIPFTTNDLSSCTIAKGDTYICHNKQLRFKKDINSCEINILNSLNTANCNLTRLVDNTTWTQLKNPNKWIFATTTKIAISAVCGTETSQQLIRGTGIMQIKPNCIIKNNFLTIQGHFDESNSLHTSYVQFRRIDQISTPQEIKRIFNNTNNQFETHLNQLNNLQKQLDESTIVRLPELIRSQSQHHHAVSYTALLISLIMFLAIIIVKLYSKYKVRKIHEGVQPTPPPGPGPRLFTIDIENIKPNERLSPVTVGQRGGEC